MKRVLPQELESMRVLAQNAGEMIVDFTITHKPAVWQRPSDKVIIS